jgi:predicted RNA-binding protein Jag
MSQRFEGHNLEEALNHAADALGVERYRISHRVIVEKRGFLGGIKRVVIEAEVDENATQPQPQAPPHAELAQTPAYAPARSARAPAGGRGGGGGRRDRGDRSRGSHDSRSGYESRGGRGGNQSQGRDHGHGRRRDQEDDLQPGDFENAMLEDAPEQGTESTAAAKARDWCGQVVTLTQLDLVVRTEENEQQIIVRFYGTDARRLLERHGELLDAMQVLANKALVGRRVEKEIEFDCGAFKVRRTEDLGQKARDVADRVRHDGHEQLLPAMSPIERRIVHLALRDDAEVTTESRGDGFFKRVAIILRPQSEETGSES